jgi:hypothetical protein
MDEIAFDRIARELAGSTSRRRWLAAALTALPLGGMVVTLGEHEVAAEHPNQRLGRRTQRRNRKQRNQRQQNNNQNNNGGGGGGGNNNNGGGGGGLGDSNCLPPFNNTTNQPTDLQQAINAASPFSNLVLCAGVFEAAGLQIKQDVSLIGAGSDPNSQSQTTLSGSPTFGGGTNTAGVLGVLSGNAFISNLQIVGANGNVPAIGIEGGSLTLANVFVGGNTAGGIVNLGGTLRLTQGTQVVGNGSDAEGGGILHRGGTTIVESGCLIQVNKATDGGGIFDATATTGDVQLGDSLIVTGNTPNNCSPAGAVQNCNG